MKGSMTSRERIMAAIKHEEPDRVPITPRIHMWLRSEYGDETLATELKAFPDMDHMHFTPGPTPNYLETYPDEYDLPEVKVVQRKYVEGDFEVAERTFHTPAGTLSDRTCIPPLGREYGVLPNPVRTECLVKSAGDLDALKYVLPKIRTDYSDFREKQKLLGDRGFLMAWMHSALDHNAGLVRHVEDLMVDYYIDRPFFDRLLAFFHERTLLEVKAALEGGAEFILGYWYFNSLSTGWSPKIFKEVFVPQIRDHVKLTHSYGAFYDYYDDGKLTDTMEMIADTGVDVLETFTPPPVGDTDLARAKKTVGKKTTIKGFVDLLYVVLRGTPDLIETTVREAMETAKPGGGFIIGSSDSIRDGTPKENLKTYFDACRKYGSYR